MRKVAIAHKANERLLELVTLDVMAKRRSPAEARMLMHWFDDLFGQLADESRSPVSIGLPIKRRYWFGYDPEMRFLRHSLRSGSFTMTFRYIHATDECSIESVGVG